MSLDTVITKYDIKLGSHNILFSKKGIVIDDHQDKSRLFIQFKYLRGVVLKNESYMNNYLSIYFWSDNKEISISLKPMMAELYRAHDAIKGKWLEYIMRDTKPDVALENRLKQLEDEVKELRLMLEYAPPSLGGSAYIEAKNDYDANIDQLKEEILNSRSR